MLTWTASLTWNPTWTTILMWSPAWTEMLMWSPAVLTVSVVKKRCISRSAKQKMQSAVASIHQLQEISCCKQESRTAVDTTDGSAGVAEPAVDWAVKMRIRPPELETSICDVKEHCDVLSMQMDSDLVIYRTTLVRTFQVTDGGIAFPVVDLIRRSTAAYISRARIPCESGWSQAPRRQQESKETKKRGRKAAGSAPCGGAIARSSPRAWPRAGRSPCANVAHGGARLCACLARPACGPVPHAVRWRRPPPFDRRLIFSAACCDLFCLLNFVQACPVQPMKFSGQYLILGRFWSDQN
ncbi:hypothetical protein F511_02144 [Dorcoceras hygrometricum]|uniref:Uncharacterized protein n=1 Tax=Dorcoceras hygrometricum TaxID=472368 RepID=A0A2Z7DG66_9LAMI|nr:hypothetical protein F511_02144 [Dorcoceras hygrometricum]